MIVNTVAFLTAIGTTFVLSGSDAIAQLTTPPADYGDAPASYRDASHNISASPKLYLGAIAPDSEASTRLTSSPSAGDDDDGNDDEDAFIVLPNVPLVDPSATSLSVGRNYHLTVPVTNTTSSNATLHAWIDFNQNGKFEAQEHQMATVSPGQTSVSISWDMQGILGFLNLLNLPLTTFVGDTHARFRLTSNTLTDKTNLLDSVGLLGIDERAYGNATNGEVEDYPVSVAVPLYDYGDAPDANSGTEPGDYQTTQSDGGPSHIVVDTIGLNLSLGNNIDGDDGSLQNVNADADDVDGTSVDVLNTLLTGGDTGLNDEDGVDVSSLPELTATPGQTYTVPVTVRNNIPLLNAFLVGYIDFNQDGDFDDAGEKSVTVTVPPLRLGAGFFNDELRTVNVAFTTPAGIVPGETYARFRLGSIQAIVESATGASVSSSTGEINNGEIEDYKIVVTEATDGENLEPSDYGDAPDSYGDASHDLAAFPNLYLGNVAPDGEADTQLTSAASAGDDDDGNDDEDAFFVLPNVPLVDPTVTSLSVGRNYHLTVPVTNTTGSNATLHAWIDFNQDGKFEAQEHQMTTVSSGQTTVSLDWDMDGIIGFLDLLNFPLTTFIGDTHARFRLTSDTLVDKTGLLDVLDLGIDERALGSATNGEVEDYPVSVAVPLYDYGDAPDTGTGTGPGNYQTTESDRGPTHVVIKDPLGLLHLSLGNNIDGDEGSLQNSNADADDVDTRDVDLLSTILNNVDLGLDDEDGVSSFPPIPTTAGQTYTVSVTVRNNVPLLNAFLVGYIDFNRDGDFDDPGERSATVTVPSDLLTITSNSLTLDTTGAPRTFDVAFTIPAGVTPGDTYARFRLGSVQEIVESATTVAISTSNGEVNNGEVEDYRIAIASPAQYCKSATGGFTDAAGVVPYISAEVGLDSVSSRNAAISLDDDWRLAASASGFGRFQTWIEIGLDLSITSPYQLLSTATGASVDVSVSSLDMLDMDSCLGTVTTSALQLSDSSTLQDGAPRPDATSADSQPDLYDSAAQPRFWSQAGGDGTSRNGVLFEFSSPVGAFGAWFGDLETRTDGGVPAILRLIDVNGNPIGTDQIIEPDSSFFSTQSDCGGLSSSDITGCGNSTTRWIGFVDPLARVAKMVVVVGDDDTGDDGYSERMSFIGATLAATSSSPGLLLVKRITAINNNSLRNPHDETPLNAVLNDGIDTPSDDHPYWPDSYLVGAIDGGTVLPAAGDSLEYTIYFLSAGGAAAKNVWICDRIPQHTRFLPDSYTGAIAADLLSTQPNPLGIALSFDGSEVALTGAEDGDRGYYFPAGIEPSTLFPDIKCGGANDNGAVVVDLGDLPPATAAGEPTDSFGNLRFQVEID
ncbi:MAG: GEVED domain-containing protein [Phormidesmis sp.]